MDLSFSPEHLAFRDDVREFIRASLPPHLQQRAAVDAFLAASRNGQIFVQLFWGLWLLPLGLLIVRTAVIPRVLGALLMFGCLGYCIKVFGLILVPDFAGIPGIRYVSIPGSVGEIGTCLWLLVMGARPIGAQGD